MLFVPQPVPPAPDVRHRERLYEQPRRQLPHDRVPGRHPAGPDDPPRRADEDPRAKSRLPAQAAQGDPRHCPAKMYDGCTRNAYHIFMYRYQKEHFAGMPRKRFLEALRPRAWIAMPGYGRLNKEAFIKNSLASRSWQRLFPAETLAKWEERTECPANDKLSEEAAWFTQPTLLGPRSDMDQVGSRPFAKYRPTLEPWPKPSDRADRHARRLEPRQSWLGPGNPGAAACRGRAPGKPPVMQQPATSSLRQSSRLPSSNTARRKCSLPQGAGDRAGPAVEVPGGGR